MIVPSGRPSWFWPLIAGAFVAATILVATLVGRLPLGMVRILRPGTAPIDLRGGVRVVFRVPPEHAARMSRSSWAQLGRTLRARGSSLGVDVEVRRDGEELIVDLDGASEEDRARFERMTRRALLEFKLVDHGTPFMLRLAARADADEDARARGIGWAADSWTHFDRGVAMQDTYLRGPDEAALRAWLASQEPSLAPDADHELRFERVEPHGDSGDREERTPWVRSYYLHRKAILDSTHIHDAEVVWDPTTNRPEVLVTFTAEGRRRFAEATGKNAGHKLAIILDDRVMSAPVIMSAITGGRSTITMGGGDPQAMARDASDLAAALRAGALPFPLELLSTSAVARSLSSARIFLYGAIWALLFGAAITAAARFAQRLRLPLSGTPTPTPTPGSAPRLPDSVALWLRLAVTAAAALLVNLAPRVRLPGINHVELRNLSPPTHTAVSGSVFDLGLAPVLFAFILVELGALAIPAWHRLRDRGPERGRLAEPIAIIAVLLALWQGWTMARWLQSIDSFGAEVMEPGPLAAGVVAISLAAGTLALVVFAAAISRWGLVNGYSLLLIAPLAARPVNYMLGLFNLGNARNVGHAGFLGMTAAEPPTMLHRAIELGLYAGVALLTIWCLRRRARIPDGPSLRLPAAGLIPLQVGVALALVFTLAADLGIPLPAAILDWLSARAFHDYAAHALLIAFLAAGLTVLFALPLPQRAPGPALAFAAVTAVLYVLAVDFAHQVATRLPHTFFSPVEVAVITAVAADGIAEWIARRRLGPLVDVWPLHQVHDADTASAALAAAGIPHHLRSTGHRSLLHLFGPFIPVSILVPPDRAADAIALLTGRGSRSGGSLLSWPPKQS